MKLSKSDRKNALKHTYVKIILILLRISWKLFALKHILYWVYVYMWYANSFLHPPPQGYCGTSLCPWPWWDQAFHSCEEGISVIELAVVFFCTEEEIYFILQPETDPNHKWASRWDYILDSMPHTKIQWFR